MSFVKLALLAAATVIAFDATAAVASIAMQFPYRYSSVGSCLIFGLFAFIAGRRLGFWQAILLGVLLGLTDATVGWAVSWAIGPGRLAPGTLSFSLWLSVAGLVMGLAALCAFIGGGIGTLMRRARAAA